MLFRLLGAQWLAVGYVGAVSFLLSIFVARSLGPDSFGVYASALAGGAIAAILVDGGFSRLLQRERAKATPQLVRHLDVLPSLAYGHALLTLALLCILAWVVYPKHAVTIVATLWCFTAAVLNQFGLSMMRGDGRLVRDALWQIGNRSISAACIVIVLLLGAIQPWQVLWAWCVGAIVFCLAVSIKLKIKPRLRIPPEIYGSLAPLIWLDLATTVYFRADIVLFHLFDIPKFNVGQYGAAYRIIEAVIMFASPVGLLLFRRFRRNDDVSVVGRPAAVSAVCAGAIGTGLAVFLFFFGKTLIQAAFGENYSQAGDLIPVLGFSLLFILPNGVLTQAALAVGLERWCAIAATIAAVFNVAGNIHFIPILGTLGAAWLTAGTEVLLCILLSLGLLARLKARKQTLAIE